MKKLKLIFCLVLSLIMTFSFTACKRGDDGGFEEDGTYKPSAKGSELEFWGWGIDTEGEVFQNLTDDFNKTIGKANNIKVNYNFIPSASYATMAKTALSGTTPPDVLYVGDGDIKSWANQGWLTRLDNPSDSFLQKNGGMDLTKIWPSAVNRYRYNTATTTSNPTDPLWGLPKDIGPTVIYYNESYMENAQITVISVPADEIELGETIPGTSKKYSYRGYDSAQKVFNNRIAMNWEETVELSNILMKGQTAANEKCDFGFFTEWWFNYGWSVGGDCMEPVLDDDGKMYYEFTLGDTQKNYMVPREGSDFEINGNTYKPGEIVSYVDKQDLTSAQKAGLDELPSMREAFTEFCRLSAGKNQTVDTGVNGYGIAMNPTTVSGVDYSTYFTTGRCAMYINGRWAVTTHRKMITGANSFKWNVAPLPVYREYNTDGTVKVEGLSSGHSGSMALAISEGSKQKNAAWMFVQYITGEVGQAAQSKQGFAIPNQMTLAENDEVFLQTSQHPKNSIIFLEAAKNQRAADWTYLKDGEWINEWAPILNSDVRDGRKTVSAFFDEVTAKTNNKLKLYTA